MDNNEKHSFPRWLFATIAIGGLLASGISIGIISVQGFSTLRLIQAAGFGMLGLLMFWGALSSH